MLIFSSQWDEAFPSGGPNKFLKQAGRESNLNDVPMGRAIAIMWTTESGLAVVPLASGLQWSQHDRVVRHVLLFQFCLF